MRDRGGRPLDAFALVRPLLHAAPPEVAHRAVIWALRHGLVPYGHDVDPPVLAVRRWGLEFRNPVGLAAGFDKNAEVVDSFPGVGFVEVGTVTPRPQQGNPKPRVFRLPDDGAVINRLGFNNEGAASVQGRLARRTHDRPVGANIGCNRDSPDPVADYVHGLRTLGPHADYVAVNVSSPNTPGLRELQRPEALDTLLSVLIQARDAIRGSGRALPILLKIAPDLGQRDLEAVVDVAVGLGIEGLIVSNTTTSRPQHLRSPHRSETGGLSGAPLRDLSTEMLRAASRRAAGRLTLVGVGGIGSGADAYAKIRAGAALVELYTALIYEGPRLVRRIKAEIAEALHRDGFGSVEEAAGVDAREGRGRA